MQPELTLREPSWARRGNDPRALARWLRPSGRPIRALILLISATLLVGSEPWIASADSASIEPTFRTYIGTTAKSQFNVGVITFLGGGEPSVGLSPTGDRAFYQHGFDTYRVTFNEFDDAHWADVTPPMTVFNVDPLLFTDAQTGRTFAGGLDGACSVMAFSDNDGALWTPMANACSTTFDHPSIASGPWHEPRPTQALHDRAVYYCSQLGEVNCATSHDGGLTFGPGIPVECGTASPGLHGSVHIASDGTTYIPFKRCGNRIGVAVSTTNGRSWQGHAVPGSAPPVKGFDPDVATTTGGWLYIGYQNASGAPMVALSKDAGSSWSTAVDVGASVGVTTAVFPEMVAGDDERAALAFLGTTTPGDALGADFTGVWHLYVALTFDGGTSWKTMQVSTDPVQRGWICAYGTGCSSGRNLLDFMDAQIDVKGRIVIAYADGCVTLCAAPTGTIAQSTSAAAALARQNGGPTLFAAMD